MTEPLLDAERVAAFLDGRLSAEQRAVVLAQIAADPDWRAVVVDAGALLDEGGVHVHVDAAPAARHVAPALELRDRSRSVAVSNRGRGTVRRGAWIALAAAAGMAITVIVQRNDALPSVAEVREMAPAQALNIAMSGNELRALTSERWSVVRAGSGEMDETSRAVRLGALSVDAMLDRERGGEESRAEIVTLLRQLNGSAASRLVVTANDSASFVAAFSAVRALVARESYDVGVWLELMRAGAASTHTGSDMLDALNRVAKNKQLSPEHAEELTARVRRLSEVLSSPDPINARDAATDVLKILAS